MTAIPTMRWQRYARPYSFKPYGLMVLVLGCVGGPLMIITGFPIGSVVFFAFGLMAVPFCFPARLRAVVGEHCVSLRQPPPYRNPLVWLPVVFGSMGVSSLAQNLLDHEKLGRIQFYGLGLCGGAVYLAIYAYRVRGAIEIHAQRVSFVHGKRYSLIADTFELYIPRNAAPSVKFSHADSPGDKASFMPSKLYGFDTNTMLSTLQQLRLWAVEDRHVTPALIKAMLDVEPPKGVDDVGASVVIPVGVAAPNPTV